MTFSRLLPYLVAGLSQRATAHPTTHDTAIILPQTMHNTTGAPLPESFLSYSIEFSFFPDFAGNASNPNNFTINLLSSIAQLQGSTPILRIGGNTQDRTIFNPNQTQAIISTYDDEVSLDQPAYSEIGPGFFESYDNFENTKFIHGLNLRVGGNCTGCLDNILQHAVAACHVLGDRVVAWEYGNEPDTWAQLHDYRPSYWDEEAVYINWREGKEIISETLGEQCPEHTEDIKYLAPSFANPFRYMDPARTWRAGFFNETDIYGFSQHNYVGVSGTPGLTVRSSLLNHSHTTWTIGNSETLMNELSLPPSVPFILGETNSLARQGLPFVSDTFGAALWNLDYALQAASVGIHRLHMHQGLNYRYLSWQPYETNRSVRATRPAFYGNAATADFVGQASGEMRVAELDLQSRGNHEQESGYVAYVDGAVERLAVLNLRLWNVTRTGQRPAQTYEFVAPSGISEARVKRLVADGSDAYSGVTYGGMSYNVELDEGRPVRLDNVTDIETIPIEADGKFVVTVPDASAVIIRLE